MILIKTSMGDIKVELFDEKAPETVKNFLRYVDSKHYEGTIFHRVIPAFMVQGGGFTCDFKQKPTKAPITNEATNGLKNLRGTLAMARTSDVNSATAQFFINVVDNAFLDHKDESSSSFGYCVFGQVTEGMSIVDSIMAVPTCNRGQFQNVPVDNIIINSIDLLQTEHRKTKAREEEEVARSAQDTRRKREAESRNAKENVQREEKNRQEQQHTSDGRDIERHYGSILGFAEGEQAMTTSSENEGFSRWVRILVCSALASTIVWPVLYFLMSLSPFPVTLYTTGLPASLFSGGVFVFVGLLVSKARSQQTAVTLSIIVTVFAVFFLGKAGHVSNSAEYVIMGIFAPVGAWGICLSMTSKLQQTLRRPISTAPVPQPTPQPSQSSPREVEFTFMQYCSHCGQYVGMTDGKSGQSITCSRCLAPIVIPKGHSQSLRPESQAIELPCPHCKLPLRIPAETKSHTFQCPNCLCHVSIPRPPPPQPTPPPVPEPQRKQGTVSIRCPHCRWQVEVPEEKRGQTIACPKCLAPLLIKKLPPPLQTSSTVDTYELGRFFAACVCVMTALTFFTVGTSKVLSFECLAANLGSVIGALIAPTFGLWVLLLTGCAIFIKLPSRAMVRESFFWSLVFSSLSVSVWRCCTMPIGIPVCNETVGSAIFICLCLSVCAIFEIYPFKKV